MVHQRLHINNLEFKAVILAVSNWAELFCTSHLMIQSDNVSVGRYSNFTQAQMLTFSHPGSTRFVSPIPDPQAWNHDDLAISWEGLNTFSPTGVLPLVLQKVTSISLLTLLLSLPFWQTRSWLTTLVHTTHRKKVPPSSTTGQSSPSASLQAAQPVARNPTSLRLANLQRSLVAKEYSWRVTVPLLRGAVG